GPSRVPQDHVLRRDRHLRLSRGELRPGAAEREAGVRAAAGRLRRAGRRRPVRRPRVRGAAGAAGVPGRRPGAADAGVRPGDGAGAAARVLGPRRAGGASRHRYPLPHPQPLRRAGHPRDRARPAGGRVGRLAQPAAADHARRALGDRHRLGNAAVHGRPARGADLVAHAAGRRDGRVPGPPGGAVPRGRHAAQPLRGGASAAGPGGRGGDGRRRRAARGRDAAAEVGRAHPAAEHGAQRGGGGVQRVGHARQPGAGGRPAGSPAGAAGGGAGGVPRRDAGRLGGYDGGGDDGVRPDGAPQRLARNGPRHRGGGIPDRPQGRALRRPRRLAGAGRLDPVRGARPAADAGHPRGAQGRRRRLLRPHRGAGGPHLPRIVRRPRTLRADAL
ncbi:MAG: Protein of unknown function (DUF1501), partial [uncultured Gemmatimonadetes bacterium]